MSHPTVDVLVSAHNAAATIGRAICSLQAQTLDDWRAVIVDNGSTDDTAAIVGRFGDGRLHLIVSPRDVGRGRARMLGLSECTAPYLALLDSDDWCMPERLEQLVAVLEAEPDLAYVGSATAIADRTGHAVVYRGPHTDVRLPAGSEWNQAILLHPTLCVRRTVFEHVGYSAAYTSEDFAMVRQLTRRFAGCVLADILYVYDVVEQSQTWRKYYVNSREVLRVIWADTPSLMIRLRSAVVIGAKVAAYGLLAVTGLRRVATRRRTRSIDPAVQERIVQLNQMFSASRPLTE